MGMGKEGKEARGTILPPLPAAGYSELGREWRSLPQLRSALHRATCCRQLVLRQHQVALAAARRSSSLFSRHICLSLLTAGTFNSPFQPKPVCDHRTLLRPCVSQSTPVSSASTPTPASCSLTTVPNKSEKRPRGG